ncbi:carboxy terminal-processing peptidase [Haemophilus parahaemolyticus]|uniref:Carboxy terminal-processing peptidase n=2 Tax=Haemophilus parahaemolyticus TaxID=735 RepID=A0AAE6MPF6_HAEPH|nr:carboxy terminal-processing peptidase [Haemophilus parahaemolyticus]EIJ67482.1 tail-specific protease [Haemophilus parahaemolyticus HK385]OOR95538.1 tail-specific protease [Haemophilus parahaemolyticus]QEN11326.1 carboxy terminal-processing peptidase [Haemophilus parahaemolyticus]QRP12519.1 carboxy terminal-processing peptidase [Haemophilus parahaemolyticus]STO66685.1 carboxy-terminal protease [Haemophilus parahaemolyticus HK385]
MKLNKASRLMALFTMGLFVNSSFAVEPQIKENALVIPKPNDQHSISTKRVTARLTQSHYEKFKLDDEFASKIFNRYIDFLDPAHNTFLQSDVEEMRAKYGTKLDDQLYAGELSAAFDMYDLMTKRRYERYKYALSLLDKEPDLKANDQIEVERDKAPFPKTTAEADKLWEERVKNDIINLYLKEKKWPEIKKTLVKRYDLAIKRLTQIKADDILQTYLNAFAREIDPHTSYLSPRAAKAFQESMNLSLEGIGATLSMEDDITSIRSLVPGAPAARSKKISVGDKIVGVGQGEKGEIEDVIGWRLDDVVDKIKGKKGSIVRLEIEPEKGGKTKIISLTRDKVRIEDSAAKLSVDKVDGKNIAVIKIPSFYIGLTSDVRKLLAQMKEKKADALIIDLRENGGGSLTEVIELSGLFIKEGPVVQVRDAFNRIKVHEDPEADKSIYDGKLMVMVNRHSASASEIFAAAMQDYNRAIIVGQQTFGKGTVQQSRSLNFVYDLDKDPLGYIQYTIQKFYRINGGSTQLKGVNADIKFPEIINAAKTGESFEDNALPWDKIPAASYQEAGHARDAVETLTQKHEERVAKNPEFIVVNEDIAIRKDRDERKFMSLNLAERKKENKADEDRRLKNLNERFKREGKKPIKDIDALPKDYEAPDFYLKETEQMMVDWLEIDKKT